MDFLKQVITGGQIAAREIRAQVSGRDVQGQGESLQITDGFAPCDTTEQQADLSFPPAQAEIKPPADRAATPAKQPPAETVSLPREHFPVLLEDMALGAAGTGESVGPCAEESGAGPDFRARVRQELQQQLFQAVTASKVKKGPGEGPDREKILSLDRTITDQAAATGDPSLILLASRFKERAERAKPQKNIDFSIDHQVDSRWGDAPAATPPPPTLPDALATFHDMKSPYLNQAAWEALAEGIRAGRWAPAPGDLETLKARMTVPSGTAALSLFAGGDMADSDFLGGVKILSVLRKKKPALLEGMTLPDRNGVSRPLTLALADRVMADNQGLGGISCLQKSAEVPNGEATPIQKGIHELHGLLKGDEALRKSLMEKVEGELSGGKGPDGMGKEGMIALALLDSLVEGADKEALDRVLAPFLEHLDDRATTRALLRGRRTELADRMAGTLQSGSLTPKETLKTLSGLIQVGYITHGGSAGAARAVEVYSPAIDAALDRLKESPEYPSLVRELVEKTGRQRGRPLGSLDLATLEDIHLLEVLSQKEKGLLVQIKKLMEPEIHKSTLKGRNADYASFLMTRYRSAEAHENIGKLGSDTMTRTERLNLYKRTNEFLSSVSWKEREALKKELQGALAQGLDRGALPGLLAMPEIMGNPEAVLKVYRKIGPGLEQDEEIAGAWKELHEKLEMAGTSVERLKTPGLPRSLRLALIDNNTECAVLLDSQEFSKVRKEAVTSLLEAIAGNRASGLSDLPSFFKAHDAISVYRTLAPGAERDEEIAREWEKLRQILQVAGSTIKKKEAVAIYHTLKERENQGTEWESLVRDLLMTRAAGGDYTDLLAEAPPAELEEFDDELMIDGIRLRKKEE